MADAIDDMNDEPAVPAPDTGGANPLHQVPVDITVSVGAARPLIGELLQLDQGAVLTLDKKVNDPVDLFVGDRLIARGELEERQDGSGGLAVRLTEIADLQTGL